MLSSHFLSDEKGAQEIRKMYAKSFQDIANCDIPNNEESEKVFAVLIEDVYAKYANILLMMARSAYAVRTRFDEIAFSEREEIHKFLDSFYMSRIGLRMLIGQYLCIREGEQREVS
jgi:pyruvate dehydrogenase kinase 2/3/4